MQIQGLRIKPTTFPTVRQQQYPLHRRVNLRSVSCLRSFKPSSLFSTSETNDLLPNEDLHSLSPWLMSQKSYIQNTIFLLKKKKIQMPSLVKQEIIEGL